MQVTVRNRAAEAPWGSGLTTPITCEITISDNCPECDAPRGVPQGRNSCDDGAYYWVQVWENPCGHSDSYPAALAEAKTMAEEASA